jgi:glycerophosphoryl diester phosphodiesterase
VIIYAHRGTRGCSPENTMSAFRQVLNTKADGIELDVQLTKDGQVVICHDHDIDRTSNGSGWIKDFTLAELKTFDFGAWYDPKFAGERIPTFTEFFTWFVTTPLILNVEIKNCPVIYDGIENKIVDIIKGIAPNDFDIYNRIIISSFYHPSLVKIKEIDDKLKTGVLFGSRPVDVYSFIRQTNADYLHPDWSCVDKRWVEEVHAQGIGVNSYTVNKQEEFDFISRTGIDGIFSDYPERWR